MRTLLIIAMLGVPTVASAQSVPQAAAACWPSSHIDKVVVQLNDGTAMRGSLLCLGVEGLTLAASNEVRQFRLEEVRQVRKAADPIWDGALKGAAIGLVALVFQCPAECVLRTAGAYGLLGLLVDAIDTNRDAIYRPAAAGRASVGFRVRF